MINPPLDVTVPAKRTPWPDAPPELPLPAGEMAVVLQENAEKHATKTRPTRKRRSKRQTAPRTKYERVSTTHAVENEDVFIQSLKI